MALRGVSGYGRKHGDEGLREFAYPHAITEKTSPTEPPTTTFDRPARWPRPYRVVSERSSMMVCLDVLGADGADGAGGRQAPLTVVQCDPMTTTCGPCPAPYGRLSEPLPRWERSLEAWKRVEPDAMAIGSG